VDIGRCVRAGAIGGGAESVMEGTYGDAHAILDLDGSHDLSLDATDFEGSEVPSAANVVETLNGRLCLAAGFKSTRLLKLEQRTI